MQFYELTHPEYLSDTDFKKANPVEIDDKNYLPGITCEECNEQWASSNRLRVDKRIGDAIADYLKKHKVPEFLSTRDWYSLVSELSTITGLPKEQFDPGAAFGVPEGIIKSNEVPMSLLHPFPGQIWVTFEVTSVLNEEHLTGVEFQQVKLKRRKKNFQSQILPQLWELIITGKAWRENINLQRITVCPCCRRTVFPDGKNLRVDQSRWDGRDFFNLDLNPNIVVVTERVCTIFHEHAFSNFLCIPV
ncbi:MAG: double-CXXCG motif protein [Bacillota bacterium]